VIHDGNDPYAVLGVSPGASQREIRGAFRTAALKWHPDKNAAANADSKFREARRAFEQLRDAGGRETTSCPACSSGPGSAPADTQVPWDEFWAWLDADEDSAAYDWVFDLCGRHWDSILVLDIEDEEVLERRLRRAESILRTVSVGRDVGVWLEKLGSRIFWIGMAVVLVVMIVGVSKSCS